MFPHPTIGDRFARYEANAVARRGYMTSNDIPAGDYLVRALYWNRARHVAFKDMQGFRLPWRSYDECPAFYEAEDRHEMAERELRSALTSAKLNRIGVAA